MESVLHCIEIRLKEYAPVSFIRRPDRTKVRRLEVWKNVDPAEPQRYTAKEYSPDPNGSIGHSLCKGSGDGTCEESKIASAYADATEEKYETCETGEGAAADVLPEDTLYYMDAQLLESLPPDALPCNMLCCSTSAACPEGKNLIRLGRQAAYQELFPLIEELLKGINRYELLIPELLRIMDQTDCVAELVNRCSQQLHIVIALRDTGFKLIAISEKSNIPEYFSRAYDRALQEYFLSEKSLSSMEGQQILQSLYGGQPYSIRTYRETTELQELTGTPVSGIYLPLKSGGQIIAFMTAIFLHHQADEADAALMEDIARLLSLALIRDGIVRGQFYGNYSALLHDVITSSITSDDMIRMRFRSVKWPLQDNLCVAVLFAEHGREHSLLSRRAEIQRQFTEIVPGSISDLYQDTIYFLISRRANEPADSFRLKRLTLFLKANHATLGLSTIFHEPSGLYRHYVEARSAVTVGGQVEPGRNIYRYDAYIVEMSVIKLSESGALKEGTFCHPLVRTLYESKRTADHDLLDTLEQYLFSMKDVARTCEALHIQRSTLFYRLKKLKDLMDENALDDGRTVQQIMYSFTVLHCMERKQLPFPDGTGR